MRDLILASVTFIIASFSVFLLNDFAGSSFLLQKAIVLPLLILGIVIYSFSKSSRIEFLKKTGKWNILFLSVVFIQLIIISTGGLKSPFFILIHLLTIGISLIFSFTIGLLFLLISFAVILIEISFRHDLIFFLLNDPYSSILQIFSLVPIIPVAYIVTQHYHIRDKLFKSLHAQVIADEAILANVDELIIITDKDFRILSVNDTVEREIQKSDSELIGRPIFEMLLIKNRSGKLIDKTTFFPEGKSSSHPANIKDVLILINSRITQRKITILAQSVVDTENNINQISFIISYVDQNKNSRSVSLSKAKAKYDALSEKVKQEALSKAPSDLRQDIFLLEKIENDIYVLQSFKDDDAKSITRFDIAQLCKQTVMREQDFSSIIKVPIRFEIIDFGQKDIEPLTVKDFPIKPDQLTGHFFTIMNDINRVAAIIKKLLDVGIFLASSEQNPSVLLTIQKITKDEITLKMVGTCPQLSQDEIKDITSAYYNRLYSRTNLHLGSGLEGYILKTFCGDLNIPLSIQSENNSITFSMQLNKANTV